MAIFNPAPEDIVMQQINQLGTQTLGQLQANYVNLYNMVWNNQAAPADKIVTAFGANGTQLFEIKNPKEDDLILDNTVFVHGGWFSFDLYEDDKLKEHNKFQVLIPF